jgi:hypothetical protein
VADGVEGLTDGQVVAPRNAAPPDGGGSRP